MWYIVVVTDQSNRLVAVVPIYAVNSTRAKYQAVASISSKQDDELLVEAIFETGNTQPNLV